MTGLMQSGIVTQAISQAINSTGYVDWSDFGLPHGMLTFLKYVVSDIINAQLAYYIAGAVIFVWVMGLIIYYVRTR